MRKYLIAGFVFGYLVTCAWGQPLPEGKQIPPAREKLPPPKAEKQKPKPVPFESKVDRPNLPIVQPTLPVVGEGRQLIAINDGLGVLCPEEIYGTFDKNGILNKVEIVPLQVPIPKESKKPPKAADVDPWERPPGEKSKKPVVDVQVDVPAVSPADDGSGDDSGRRQRKWHLFPRRRGGG